MIRNIDSRYPKDYCLSQNTFIKVQIQGLITKKSKPKESRLKETKPANGKSSVLPHSNEAIKLNYQEKKKSIGRKNKIKKILFQPLKTMLLKVVMRRKKAMGSAIIA